MPGFDRSGPDGKGPLTGGNRGLCGSNSGKDPDEFVAGQGRGRGPGQGGAGMGRGGGAGQGGGSGRGRGLGGRRNQQMNNSSSVNSDLEERARELESELKAVKEKLAGSKD
jgi:Family of unknown function (DUF5320)